MIAASTYLPSASSRRIAASSIQGTGAQSLASALRNGCTAVSVTAFGPNCFSRRRASSLVRPFGEPLASPPERSLGKAGAAGVEGPGLVWLTPTGSAAGSPRASASGIFIRVVSRMSTSPTLLLSRLSGEL